MIRTLIKIAIIAVAAILTYNYFFGDERERQQSEQVINKIKEAGTSLWELLKDEKEKIDEGKYDDVVQNIKEAIQQLRDKGVAVKDKLEEIEKKLDSTENQVSELQTVDSLGQKGKRDSIERDLRDIIDKLENISTNNQ